MKAATSATSVAVATQPVFQNGETVYSAIASNERGMVTGILQRPDHIGYYVMWASAIDGEEREYGAIELSRDPLFHQATR